MTVIKQIGLGASLSVKGTTASTTAYTVIAGIVSMPGPDAAGTAIDTYTLDSTDNFVTKLRGSVDPGDMTLVLAYNNSDASSKQLGTLFADGTLMTFKVEYPSTAATAESFEGFINGMGRAIERDAMITRPVTITVSGDPGFATT